LPPLKSSSLQEFSIIEVVDPENGGRKLNRNVGKFYYSTGRKFAEGLNKFIFLLYT
jgi:hypothetical protein